MTVKYEFDELNGMRVKTIQDRTQFYDIQRNAFLSMI